MSDQVALPDVTTRRDLAVERSQKVSRALHDAARKARQTVRGATVWQPGYSRAKRGNRMFTLVSAIVICIVPTLLFTAYISLFASNQYQVDAKFAVKSRSMMLTDMLGSLTGGGLGAFQQTQDSQLIIDYVESRELVAKLDREFDLRAIYAKPSIDYFSRFNPDDTIEDLVQYWHRRTKIKLELPANILHLSVRAFSPEEALQLGRAVVAASETLVNGISDRLRQDAVAKAQAEVERAERHLVETRQQYRQTRDEAGILDPKRSGDELVRMLAELRLDRLKLESEIQVSSRSLTAQAPQIQTLRAKREAITGQIANLEKEMTASAGQAGALSQTFIRFDKSRLDQEVAEKNYQTMSAALEKARIDSERQQVYLEPFVKPTMPETAEYPRRIWLISIVFGASLLIWFLITWIRSLVYG